VEKGEWTTADGSWFLAIIELGFADLAPQRYFLPLAIAWEDDIGETQQAALAQWTLARVRQKGRMGLLYGAFGDEHFCRALARGIGDNLDLPLGNGRTRITFRACPSFAALADGIDTAVRQPALEQSNTAVYFDNRLFLKGYRRVQPGTNPEVEVGRFLAEQAAFPHIVPVAGAIELDDGAGLSYTLALLQPYVEHQNIGWSYALDYVDRFLTDQLAGPEVSLERPHEDSPHGFFLALMEILGRRTGELHVALCRPTDDAAFAPEPIGADDIEEWCRQARSQAVAALDALEAGRKRFADGELAAGIDRLLGQRQALLDHFAPRRLAGAGVIGGLKTRYHGNYHLGQVLLVQNDFVITDFEGNPERELAQRRRKHSPLRDVASMLRCFSYVAAMATNRATAERPADRHRLGPLVQRWETETAVAFLSGYYTAMAACPAFGQTIDATQPLLEFFTIEKALDELRSELEQRPDWLPIPLFSLLRRLDHAPEQPETDR
jgi:maltose alpha-D-glucosyltransferase/alpha-amylase